MEGLVNYSSEDEKEDSPKRNVAERCLALEIDPNKRSKGDSSRRFQEENTRNITESKSQNSSHRDKDSHGSFRKSTKEEHSRSSGRLSGNRDRDHYHRTDRHSDRVGDKKRYSKDDRKRRDGNRERDRDYDYRDTDRDHRVRSERYRRERYDKDSLYRDRDRRRRSPEASPPTSKDRNTASSYKSRNRSRSRSSSKESPSYSKMNTSIPPTDNVFRSGSKQKSDQKEEGLTAFSLSQSKSTHNLQAVVNPPLNNASLNMPNPSGKLETKTIALPTYYNPNIINPTKYAEQVQKRKLIWGAKKSEDTAAKWGHATFSEDSDGKVASKFMRLMGIKSAPKPGENPAETPVEKTGPDVKSRQAMFSNMEQQYEVARQVTHTMRGVGLGFGSQSRQY